MLEHDFRIEGLVPVRLFRRNQDMMPADSDVYFNAPGCASVRWDRNGTLVLVEWEGWADQRSSRPSSMPRSEL